VAERGARTIEKAVRELCLAFPEVEEFESHGSPNFRARKGKVFAVWALNHHGDGHVALWLATPKLEQSRLLTSSKHLFKPPYVGPAGWIGVELNRGVSWKRVIDLVHMAYLENSPPKLVAQITRTPAIAAPTLRMEPEQIDRLLAPGALRVRKIIDAICRELPETSVSASFGSPTWRVGKRGFVSLYDYGKGLTVAFWVGIERQGPLEMDPRMSIPKYLGAKGWMALDVSKSAPKGELREFIIESWRHFAPKRAIAKLDANLGVA
jgi:predicted DNA-binding protein (MmcQ/YjbR family)